MKSAFITAKELAEILDMAPKTLLALENKLGLDKCRDHNFKKPFRWFRDEARQSMEAAGYKAEVWKRI